MTLQETRKKLALARLKEKNIKNEIKLLRQIIIDAGEHPNPDYINLIERNKAIYKTWKDGRKFSQVAKEFKLSATTIRSICRRLEVILSKEKSKFGEYKDLRKYK